MDWLALLISGLIFPLLWWILRQNAKAASRLATEILRVKENDLAHAAADIREIRNNVAALTEKFITHLEGHS